MKLKFITTLLLLLIGTSCGQNPNVPSITADELISKMESDSSLIVLDVRTPQELVGPLGKIESVINIPIQNLSDRLKELEKYKDKDFAVICRSGNRSTFGTKILLENGFKAVNVLGGMKAYRNKAGN